jgi:uncharacterized protein VirK/YbjX
MLHPSFQTIPQNRWGVGAYVWKLTQELHQERNWRSRLVKSLGASLSAFAQKDVFVDWLSFLQKPENQAILEANPFIRFRTLRGYVSTCWGNEKKLKVLKDSLRFAHLKRGPLLESLTIPREEKLTISDVPLGENLGNIQFKLSNSYRFRREGQWTLSVHCDKIGDELCSIAFAVEEVNGQWVAYAGAIQGGAGANEETIKASWKAMHGVRAKAMAIFALQEVVSALGVSRLLGAGNSIQMSSGKHMISVPWNKISFNYNQMWEEADGEAVEEGWFELPLREIRRTREEIKTNKRALYARRYALFDQLSAAVTQGLAAK